MSNELRDRLAQAWMDLHYGDMQWQWHGERWDACVEDIDALLPLIREHTATAVAAERERIAVAIKADLAAMPNPHKTFELGIKHAARIAREEHADG